MQMTIQRQSYSYSNQRVYIWDSFIWDTIWELSEVRLNDERRKLNARWSCKWRFVNLNGSLAEKGICTSSREMSLIRRRFRYTFEVTSFSMNGLICIVGEYRPVGPEWSVQHRHKWQWRRHQLWRGWPEQCCLSEGNTQGHRCCSWTVEKWASTFDIFHLLRRST